MNQITGATKACTWGRRHVTPSVLFYTCVVQKSMAGYNIRDTTSFSEVSHFDYCETQGKKKKNGMNLISVSPSD